MCLTRVKSEALTGANGWLFKVIWWCSRREPNFPSTIPVTDEAAAAVSVELRRGCELGLRPGNHLRNGGVVQLEMRPPAESLIRACGNFMRITF